MKDVFENIITNRLWRDVPCGSGSTLAYTAHLRQQLPQFVHRHDIHSVLDLPCGDYSWMSQVCWPESVRYHGADIVDSMIQQNQQNYPEIQFSVIDMCQDPLPAVDLLFCRDCLFHLSYTDIARAFGNIASSDIRWVLTTTYPDVTINKNVVTGGFRPINLTLPPFDLPEPIDHLPDWIEGHRPRIMGLWHKSNFKVNFV